MVAKEGAHSKTEPREEVLSGPNTEAINFRVPKAMKAEIKELCEFQRYASAGELLRSLVRAHAEKVKNSQAYKYYLKTKEQEEL